MQINPALAACLAAAWLSAGLAEDAPEQDPAVSDVPTAGILLDRVRARLPRETLNIRGQLLRGARIGRLEQAFRIEALLEWGKTPPYASYSLSDSFGAPVARLTVTRPPGRPQQFLYEQGQPLKPAPTPDLNQPIEGAELTWNDLTLSFLWWPGGTMAGRDNIRGRDCYVIEVPVPPRPGNKTSAPAAAPAGDSNGVASVRLWIDDRLVVLIQMEEYDAAGKLMRRMSVKNFKKIGDLWMVKNLDIRRYPSHHRTQIRIEEVAVGGVTNAPDMELPGD